MPSRVEDYEVLNTIGSGSHGRCQKIRRKSDGKVLVWKELDYGTMAVREKRMLVSEVNLLRKLRHPNIVRYYDHIIDGTNTTLYIVMEYCEGGDLSALISRCLKERRYLGESFILRLMAQLTLALMECHRWSDGRATVLHRDLKPANIFLDVEQNVKLGDFGLARTLNHDTSFAKTFVGTPYYMSPEQINRVPYNEKSDIWSLGCLLYELCTLSPPFTAYSERELAEKIRVGKFRRIPYQYSENLNTLLSKMLNLKDYLRPSVESILQSSLLSKVVCKEQRKAQERHRRISADSDCVVHKPAEPVSVSAAELKLREQALRDREQALRDREQALRDREQELCVRERLSNELARAERLLKIYNHLQQLKDLSPLYGKDIETIEPLRALLKQDAPWVWTLTCSATISQLEKQLISPPVLAHFNPQSLTFVTCNTSNISVGAVLSQLKTKASKGTKLIIHLVSAMFLLNLTFLTSNYVAKMQNLVGYKIMAARMHYFMLVTFTLFAAQAFHLCIQLCWITDSDVHYIVNIGYYSVIFLFTFTYLYHHNALALLSHENQSSFFLFIYYYHTGYPKRQSGANDNLKSTSSSSTSKSTLGTLENPYINDFKKK
ncbi:serine/threonine-protein kinase Nek2-like [Pholidichthys leucotaenia]